jgi:hypothetical protein
MLGELGVVAADRRLRGLRVHDLVAHLLLERVEVRHA